MSENVRKLVGVAAMAALVVVGVVVSSGDDTNFTRNYTLPADLDIGRFQQLPEAEQARLAPAFLEQAAPKANHLNRDPIFRYVPDGRNDGKVSIEAQKDAAWNFKDGKSGSDIKALSAGKASVLEGRGVDGKGGTSSLIIDSTQVGVVSGRKASFRAGCGVDGLSTGKASVLEGRGVDGKGGTSSIRAGCGMDGVVDRIEKCGLGSMGDSHWEVASLKNVMITSYMENTKDLACLPTGDGLGGQEGEGMLHDTAMAIRVGKDEAKLLAECMESKVGDVFLKSHIESSAADCVAIVLPALSPERAKRLGTYWQTQQQLVGTD